jgi:hypothetical protein
VCAFIHLLFAASPDDVSTPPGFSEDMAPSESPSTTFSPTAALCPVSVMLHKCPQLLQTIEPVDGCECYNFCGGMYLGCCGIDQPCPLSCDILGGFVAGCQFAPTPSPSSTRPPTNTQSPTRTLVPTAISSPTSTPSLQPSQSLRPAVTASPFLTNIPSETQIPTISSEPVPTSMSLPSSIPSLNPSQSLSPVVTQSPSLTDTPSEAQIPTISSEPSNTMVPSNETISPTQSSVPTMDPDTLAPTVELLQVSLTPFTLEYELGQSRPAAQSDLVELTSTTNSYLQSYMLSVFQTQDVLLVDFVTTYDSHQDFPSSSLVLVTFGSSAAFDPGSPKVPSDSDLEMERSAAFEGMALAGYLGMVQSLPTNNLFSSTLQIFLVKNTGNTPEQKASGIGVVAASLAVLVVSVLTGTVVYRSRRKRRRRQASEKFLNDIDSKSGVTTMANSNEGEQSLGSDGGGLERIEVMLCETEQDEENVPNYVLDNKVEEFAFEQERGYIYKDEPKEHGGIGESKTVDAVTKGNADPEENVRETERFASDFGFYSEPKSPTIPARAVDLSPSEDSYGFSSVGSPPLTQDVDDDDENDQCTCRMSGH